MASHTITDEQVLSDPGEHTVDEVVGVFGRASAEQIDGAKALEAAGQGRKGILEYEPKPPPAAEPYDPTKEEFSRERLLGSEGSAITGHRRATIVGALHGDEADTYTRDEVLKRIDEFLKRPVGGN